MSRCACRCRNGWGNSGVGRTQSGGVCLITSSYPSPAEATRGAFVEDIATGLSARFPVTVVVPLVYPDDPVRESRRGIPVVRFPFGSGGKLLKTYGHTPLLMMVRYMLAGVQAGARAAKGCRLVFAHWVVPTGVIGALVSRLTGRPLVLYAHGSDICVYAEKSLFYRLLTRWVLGRARFVFAVSRDIEARLTGRLGMPEEAVAVVSCGVDGGLFHPAESPLPTDKEPLRVLFVGDMVAAKGVVELVEAVLALLSRAVALELEMVGNGPLREELTGQVRRAGAEKAVRFVGTVPRSEVAERMRQVHVLVLPSHNEGTPLCVMEALTSGIPVVATAVGGIPDLVDEGESGLLIPPENREALSRALERLAVDRGFLARLTAGARKTGDRFFLDRRQREVCEILAALMDAPEAV